MAPEGNRAAAQNEPADGNGDSRACYRLRQVEQKNEDIETRIRVMEDDVIEQGKLLATTLQAFKDMRSTIRWGVGVITLMVGGLIGVVLQQLVRDTFFH